MLNTLFIVESLILVWIRLGKVWTVHIAVIYLFIWRSELTISQDFLVEHEWFSKLIFKILK